MNWKCHFCGKMIPYKTEREKNKHKNACMNRQTKTTTEAFYLDKINRELGLGKYKPRKRKST